MSINKSLSALGDVISALSSDQSFIPYRLALYYIYRQQRKLRKGNVFTSVYQELCPRGLRGVHVWQEGGVCGRGVCMAGGMHVRGVCGRGVCMAGGVRGKRDGHCSGWYASYWNAFFLICKFDNIDWRTVNWWSCIKIFTMSQRKLNIIYVSLQLLVQNQTKKWHFPLNFRNDIDWSGAFSNAFGSSEALILILSKNSPIRGWGGLSKMSKKCP